MKRVYSASTYRIRELEKIINMPLVSEFKDEACGLIKKKYPDEVEGYLNYKVINKEFRRILNYLKKTYGRDSISKCKNNIFISKQHKKEYNEYCILLERRRVYNKNYKFIKPLVEKLALEIYKKKPKVKETKELKEFLNLLKGLVIYTIKAFYKQHSVEEDLIEGLFQSCYIAYIQNYDRSFGGKVDTFFVTNLLNSLSALKTREIPSEDFSRLSSKSNESVLLINQNSVMDRNLTWELAKNVL